MAAPGHERMGAVCGTVGLAISTQCSRIPSPPHQRVCPRSPPDSQGTVPVKGESEPVLGDITGREAHEPEPVRCRAQHTGNARLRSLAARPALITLVTGRECMDGIDEIRALSLFDGLTDDQLADLVAGSTVVRVEPGTEPFREGEHADFWWVLIDGAIDLVRRVGGEDAVVGKMHVPGRWAGGFRAWDEHGVYLATARASALSRCSGCRPACCVSGSARSSRSAATSSRGFTRPRVPSSRPRGSASSWSPWASSRPASPTRSTTRRRPRPVGGRPGDRMPDAAL